MKDLTGATLGKYQVLERLGRGGMADVYRAYQPGMDRYVAIKVLHGHLSEDTGFIERFKREAQSVGTLRHPNIVQVIDFDAVDDEYYMVMEFVEGDSLKALLSRRGALPVAEAIALMVKIADAVGYAHRAGMIHRDLKPANILMTKAGEPILTDFGIAKILSASNLTATGVAIGTPAYMSPEAGRGEKVDERADIYSLGVMFYEMVTGSVPFDADTPWAVILKHINEPLPRPTAVLPNLPQSVERIILKSLAKAPSERFQTAADFREALVKASHALPESQPTVNATDSPTTQVAKKTTPATPTRPAGRSRSLVFGALTLVLVIGAAAVYFANESVISLSPDKQTATAVAALPSATSTVEPTATTTATVAPTSTATTPPTTEPSPTPIPPAAENTYDELTRRIAKMISDGLYDQALEEIAKPLADDPQNYALQQLRALVLVQYREDANKLEEGKALAEAGVAAQPDRPQAYFVLAMYWGMSPHDDYAKALELATQAIDKGMTMYVQPYVFHGTMLYYLGRPSDEILADLAKAIALEPANEELYRRRGFYQLEINNLAGAQADLQKALELVPDNYVDLHAPLAWILLQQNEPDKAFDLYRQTMQTQVVSNPAYIADAALIAIRTDHPAAAAQWAGDARAIDPNLSAAKYAQVWIAWAKKDYTTALQYLDEIAASDDPGSYHSSFLLQWYRLGREVEVDRAFVLNALNRKDEAIQALQAAVNNYGDWFEPYMALARLYSEKGDKQAARETLQKALELASSHKSTEERARALALLKELGD